jgi:hypothetical protein
MSNMFTINGIHIAKEILTKRFAPCDLRACAHACCHQGAMVGTVRIKKIRELLPKLLPMMRPEAVRLVKRKGFHLDTLYYRSDMDNSHDHYYLRVAGGRCVFLAYDDSGGCVLQKYASRHRTGFTLKPEGCWLFPIDLIGNRLVVYKWNKLPCLNDAKNRKSPPLYKTCKPELTAILGENGYKELMILTRLSRKNRH